MIQAAEVGCTANNVKTRLAADALEQIRRDIVRRKGRAIKYRYLITLGRWAVMGILLGALVVAASCYVAALSGYGWVIAGSMVGAWLSLASTRRQVSFDSIQDVVNVGKEPVIKLIFVAILASTLAFLLEIGVISLSLGDIDLAEFHANARFAVLLGLVTGISERAASVQVIDRIRGTFVASPN